MWNELNITQHIKSTAVVVQSVSRVWPFVTTWTAACQASPSLTISLSLLRQTLVHWVGDAIQPSHPLLSSHPCPLLLSTFPSIRIFSYELTLCMRWPKYWSFSFSISPTNEYSGLISLKIDWFDLLAVQETLYILLAVLSRITIITKHIAFVCGVWVTFLSLEEFLPACNSLLHCGAVLP